MKNRIERGFPNGRFELKAASDALPEGSFSGYGALFNTLCPTSSWSLPPDWQDRFLPGAFANAIKERKKNGGKFPACWQHDLDCPVGAYDLVEEDSTGLRVEGLLATKTVKGAETYELMKIGAISGLSVQYRPLVVKLNEKEKIRDLAECKLIEIAPCTIPNMDGARVADVKAMSDRQHTQTAAQIGALMSCCEDCEECGGRDEMMAGLKACLDTMGEGKAARPALDNPREFERRLRDVLALSQAEAKRFMADGFKGLTGQRDADLRGLADALQHGINTLRGKAA